MYEKCCIHGCGMSRAKQLRSDVEISFHKFPLDPKKWIDMVNILNRQNIEITKKTRICSKHFTETDFLINGYSYRRIRGTAFPTIFPNFNPDESEQLEILDDEVYEEKNPILTDTNKESTVILPIVTNSYDDTVIKIEPTLDLPTPINFNILGTVDTMEMMKIVEPVKTVDPVKPMEMVQAVVPDDCIFELPRVNTFRYAGDINTSEIKCLNSSKKAIDLLKLTIQKKNTKIRRLNQQLSRKEKKITILKQQVEYLLSNEKD